MRNFSFVFLAISILFMSNFFTACSQKRTYSSSKHTSAATHRATMRSYNVRGKRYHPTYVEVGQVMKGISSWYGPNFHGKHTSNGEVYNMHARTAAHKTWPMDTMVRVRNLQNGKSTVVRINDRGPFVSGRVIDCSYAAGKEIGLDKMGIAKVSVEVLGFAGKIQVLPKNVSHKKAQAVKRIALSNFGLQVGAFMQERGAKIYQAKYANKYLRYKPIIKHFNTRNSNSLYRVWLMGFGSEEEARDFKYKNDLNNAFTVRN